MLDNLNQCNLSFCQLKLLSMDIILRLSFKKKWKYVLDICSDYTLYLQNQKVTYKQLNNIIIAMKRLSKFTNTKI